MTYLFIGQDNLSKDIKLAQLKKEVLTPELAQFNLDTVYGKELTLVALQEKLSWLPFKLASRMLVIKDAGSMRQEIKDYLVAYVKKAEPSMVLVLDFETSGYKDAFVNSISSYAQISRFKEEEHLDVFALSRQIAAQRTAQSLKILKQLLKNGDRPEQIVGALRSSFERANSTTAERRKQISLLLDCDIDIKTGKLNPVFALERFIVAICGSKGVARK